MRVSAPISGVPYRPLAIRQGQYDFDLTGVSQAYVDKVDILSRDLPNRPELGGTSLATAFQVASSLVGIPGAVALAGDVMVEMCDDECLEEVDQALNQLEGIKPETKLAGTDVMVGFGNPEELGQAKYTTITLDPQLKGFLGAPLGDFIAGHELGHLEEKDMLRRMGHVILQSAVLDDELGQQVADASQAIAREKEFEADKAGIDYALSRGHSEEDVVKATNYLMTLLNPEGDATHPSTNARKDVIRRYLEEKRKS